MKKGFSNFSFTVEADQTWSSAGVLNISLGVYNKLNLKAALNLIWGPFKYFF
jgi:hypothetical protein